jgi:hypothetical protein
MLLFRLITFYCVIALAVLTMAAGGAIGFVSAMLCRTAIWFDAFAGEIRDQS